MYIDEVFRSLRGHKRLADDAIAQLSDDQFFALPDAESNSVAVVVKHMAGNMRSRFTDFLTTDGEKPDRNRDQEFIIAGDASRAEILAVWEKYWQLVFDTLNGINPKTWSVPSRYAANLTPCCRPSTGKWPTTPTTWDRSCFSPNTGRARSGRH